MKRYVSVIIIGLMLSMCFNVSSVSSDIIETTSSGITLYVDDDGGSGNYTRIQDAIDNASDGDTVFVYNGTYFENIIIEKSIKLIGENKESTIINGTDEEQSVVFIFKSQGTISDVLIKDFTIRNGKYGITDFGSNTIIRNNIIDTNKIGLISYLWNVQILNNYFYENDVALENDGVPEEQIEIKYNHFQNNKIAINFFQPCGVALKCFHHNNFIENDKDVKYERALYLFGQIPLEVLFENYFYRNYWDTCKGLDNPLKFFSPHRFNPSGQFLLDLFSMDLFPARKPYEI